MKLRRATMRDADFLLDLKNDQESLRWSWDHDPVTPGVHRAWLEKALFHDDPSIYIGMVGKKAVGAVRTRVTLEGDEISITVAQEYRGKGLGTAMLMALPKQKEPYVAYIDGGNVASKMAFVKAGFTVRWKAEKVCG